MTTSSIHCVQKSHSYKKETKIEWILMWILTISKAHTHVFTFTGITWLNKCWQAKLGSKRFIILDSRFKKFIELISKEILVDSTHVWLNLDIFIFVRFRMDKLSIESIFHLIYLILIELNLKVLERWYIYLFIFLIFSKCQSHLVTN